MPPRSPKPVNSCGRHRRHRHLWSLHGHDSRRRPATDTMITVKVMGRRRNRGMRDSFRMGSARHAGQADDEPHRHETTPASGRSRSSRMTRAQKGWVDVGGTFDLPHLWTVDPAVPLLDLQGGVAPAGSAGPTEVLPTAPAHSSPLGGRGQFSRGRARMGSSIPIGRKEPMAHLFTPFGLRRPDAPQPYRPLVDVHVLRRHRRPGERLAPRPPGGARDGRLRTGPDRGRPPSSRAGGSA